jgi:hypothetical protein
VRADKVEPSQAFRDLRMPPPMPYEALVSGLRSEPSLHRLQLPGSNFGLVGDFFYLLIA